MQHKNWKLKKPAQGVSKAVLLSAGIHAVLLVWAGGVVVFSVVQKSEKKFVPPPPVRRPKMQIKKPTVRVKKKVYPKSSQRISSKNMQTATGIRLTKTGLVSEGLGGGVEGFELMPDIADVTLLGGKESLAVGNDFEGVFYALCVDRQGRKLSGGEDTYIEELRRFYEHGWNPKTLMRYYRAPQKLYTTFFYLPTIGFEHIPRSFGIPDSLDTEQWLVHYQGRIMSRTGGRFRFWGRGLAVLALRVDEKEVGFLGQQAIAFRTSDWRSSAEQNMKYYSVRSPMVIGDWFSLEADVPVSMDVLIGDFNGYDSAATLTVQEEGVIYPKNRDGAPILPVFKTAEIPPNLLDEIRYLTIAGDADLESSLMFNVF
ncbi:hypothetical protein [Tichowtungia aerotolerans]|uniref:Uncharacterized protein n=1 Tax=Tichowtungia aerotolerans TaxID=2697043 RepID=A0A6P1M7V2_9BACT|nr:hypothetical protein [Tichowtungia aerotolerans]QHI70789.1 hypothetical protein GT409_15520 [Tichowtungia aerotolerans]